MAEYRTGVKTGREVKSQLKLILKREPQIPLVPFKIVWKTDLPCGMLAVFSDDELMLLEWEEKL